MPSLRRAGRPPRRRLAAFVREAAIAIDAQRHGTDATRAQTETREPILVLAAIGPSIDTLLASVLQSAEHIALRADEAQPARARVLRREARTLRSPTTFGQLLLGALAWDRKAPRALRGGGRPISRHDLARPPPNRGGVNLDVLAQLYVSTARLRTTAPRDLLKAIAILELRPHMLKLRRANENLRKGVDDLRSRSSAGGMLVDSVRLPKPATTIHRHCGVVGPQGWACGCIPPRPGRSSAPDESCFGGVPHGSLGPPCRCPHRRCQFCDVGMNDGHPFVAPVISHDVIAARATYLGDACEHHRGFRSR